MRFNCTSFVYCAANPNQLYTICRGSNSMRQFTPPEISKRWHSGRKRQYEDYTVFGGQSENRFIFKLMKTKQPVSIMLSGMVTSDSDIIRGAFNKFPDFFVQAFKIVVNTWKFSMLLLYILWDESPIFMIWGSNEQLHQELEYTRLKPRCHSWWISKMQFRHEGTLEERYAIKFCFKLGNNVTEMYGMLQTAFQSSGSLWGMMRGVGGVRKSIHHKWLAKGLELGFLCWGFMGVQEEIPREESSTLQIGSVTFPRGQCTSPQLHLCHRLFDQDGHQDSSSASLQSRPCYLWLLVIP